jgi:hypothetical protein
MRGLRHGGGNLRWMIFMQARSLGADMLRSRGFMQRAKCLR